MGIGQTETWGGRSRERKIHELEHRDTNCLSGLRIQPTAILGCLVKLFLGHPPPPDGYQTPWRLKSLILYIRHFVGVMQLVQCSNMRVPVTMLVSVKVLLGGFSFLLKALDHLYPGDF